MTVFFEVGDMHVIKDNLEESRKFIQWLIGRIQSNLDAGHKVKLIFLGDQMNDFGVAKVEVVDFWDWAYDELSKVLGLDHIITITGNHDRNSEGKCTALGVYKGKSIIVDKQPYLIDGDIAVLSYIRNNDEFEKQALHLYSLGIRMIYCHAEFNMAEFEGGYFSPHGIDPKIFPADLMFVSGHVHKKQSLGNNVFYGGTPRHLMKSDIGEVKGIHIYNPETKHRIFLATPEDICEPFKLLEFKEGDTIPKDIPNSPKIYIQFTGTKDWCNKVEAKLPPSVKARPIYTDITIDIKVKESDGIPVSFQKYWAEQDIPEEYRAEVLKLIMDNCPQLSGGVVSGQ